MNETQITAGIDIGGTNTTVGLVDPAGHIHTIMTFPTSTPGGADHFVARIAMALNEESLQLPTGHVLVGIGVASPAANMREGTIHRAANLTWGTINIVRMLKQYFELPVAIINDSNASALGELHYGFARKMKNFVVITLGTGLGAGIVVDGRLLQGEKGIAGEFGHMTFDPSGRQCGCGRRGCAEAYISATGLCRTALELTAQRSAPSALRSIAFEFLNAKKVFELARDGDGIAQEAFRITGEHLGRLLTDIAAILDPQAIIVAGGLANAGELLMAPARAYFESHVLDLHQDGVDLVTSSLPNGQAAVLGASRLVRELVREKVLP